MHTAIEVNIVSISIPCPFLEVGLSDSATRGICWVMAIATLRERASTQPTNQDFFQFRQGIVSNYSFFVIATASILVMPLLNL